MKCDELKAYKADVTIPVYGTIADTEVYLKDKADAAIAELKVENENLKESNGFLRSGFSCGEGFEKLKARTTSLIHDKAITPEVRRLLEKWRDCAYHSYYLYAEECEAYQDIIVKYHEMSTKRHMTTFEKFGICVMAVIEKFSTMFRRTK